MGARQGQLLGPSLFLLFVFCFVSAEGSRVKRELIPIKYGNADAECEVGAKWRRDCNWCMCTPSGAAACTRRVCPPGFSQQALVSETPECIGSASYKVDCNWCHCDNGTATCTSAACGHVHREPIAVTSVSVSVREEECTEGSRWRKCCNWCTCTNGVGSCTRRACLPNYDETSEPECEGTSRWRKDCNWCNCVEGRGVCTSRACFDREDHPQLPAVETREQECTEGSRWRQSCNWCMCTNGVGSCTRRACLPNYDETSEPECEGTSRWKKDCNWCNCVEGRGVCTSRLCIDREDFPQRPSVTTAEAQCTEGSRWRQSCNWCTCRNGLGLCTKKSCLPNYEDTSEPECEGTSRWKKDCNWCNCVEGRGVCTARACSPPDREPPQPTGEGVECREGSRWRKNCNWCSCVNGVGVCTAKMCLPGQTIDEPECEGSSGWVKDCNWCDCVDGQADCGTKECEEYSDNEVTVDAGEEEVCTEGSLWRNECNWCRCTNGMATCTYRGCPPGYQTDEPECRGTARWKKDCNWCNCVNERGVCTSRACAERSPLSVRPDATCTDGSSWRQECNWCHCLDGFAACTLKGCLPGYQSDEPECLPDSHWKKDCNWCQCASGLAVCTKKQCGPVDGDVCVDGTTWREDCNLCRCSNGRAMCTRRLCPSPRLPPQCLLPAVDANNVCFAFIPMWTFDQSNGRCEEIVYGGCGGTSNLYDSQAECESACPVRHQARSIPQVAVSPQNQERCYLTPEQGPCFADFIRYAYQPSTGQCIEFHYGGCQGNGNNFDTIEECLSACTQTPQPGRSVNQGLSARCQRQNCPWEHWGHYLAQDCRPEYRGDDCCPSSFTCPPQDSVDNTKCHYKGQDYAMGEEVPVEEPCSAGCTCARSFRPNSPPEVRCANVECPSVFNPPQPGCRPIYQLDQCCEVDQECVDPSVPLEPRAAVCTYKNQTYQEGDKMFFDDHPCRECVCQPGFTGPYGRGCGDIDCGWDFRFPSRYADGCTPIFFEDKCCPIDWMCPGDGRIQNPPPEQQSQATVRGPEAEIPTCSVGDVVVAVGENAVTSSCQLTCRCITPPSLTCVQYRSCELAEQNDVVCEPLAECSSECQVITDISSGCPTCSCTPNTFTCPPLDCPPGCSPDLDLQTGCKICKCDCNYNELGMPPCPSDCPVEMTVEESTGCNVCQCISSGTQGPMVRSEECPTDHTGRAPCPLDCAIMRYTDEETGCEVCKCDPSNTRTPWDNYRAPSDCPVDPNGRPHCPMDCGVIIRVDEETGCEVCQCDPNDHGNPWGPIRPPIPRADCLLGPDGRAPCPMDCAIIRSTDPQTGCEVCTCDPENPGNPFVKG